MSTLLTVLADFFTKITFYILKNVKPCLIIVNACLFNAIKARKPHLIGGIMSRKTLYFDSWCGYVVSAAVENGKLTEFGYERLDRGTVIGNIYKGRVESILTGMQAAFVNCGLARNCYLSTEGELPDADKYDSGKTENGCTAPAFPPLKVGDEVMVQVVKAPVGKKGAKVTLRPSFVGNCLIYMPEIPFVGVSRKIADEELRRNLAFSAERLKKPEEGLILRTAAPYAKRDQLQIEYSYLKNTYAGVKRAFEEANVGDLLHTDSSLPVRVLRDTLANEVDGIVVGTKELKAQIDGIMSLFPPHTRRPVTLHDTGRDMMEELGVTRQISELASPRVDLDNGAYLVIEKTEALTVIDVNTGKFTGDDSLEQTVYYTNILAAREIARQVKLRNIGGIVVVDFIDMLNETHKNALVEELERALAADKAKCAVSPMSQFGLVEFTRKRIGINPLSHMIKPCRYCREAGHTLKEEFIIFGLRAKLMRLVTEGATAIRVDMNAEVLAKLAEFTDMLADLRNRCKTAKFYAVPHKTYHEEQLNFRTVEFEIPKEAFHIT